MHQFYHIAGNRSAILIESCQMVPADRFKLFPIGQTDIPVTVSSLTQNFHLLAFRIQQVLGFIFKSPFELVIQFLDIDQLGFRQCNGVIL